MRPRQRKLRKGRNYLVFSTRDDILASLQVATSCCNRTTEDGRDCQLRLIVMFLRAFAHSKAIDSPMLGFDASKNPSRGLINCCRPFIALPLFVDWHPTICAGGAGPEEGHGRVLCHKNPEEGRHPPERRRGVHQGRKANPRPQQQTPVPRCPPQLLPDQRLFIFISLGIIFLSNLYYILSCIAQFILYIILYYSIYIVYYFVLFTLYCILFCVIHFILYIILCYSLYIVYY